MTKKKWEDEVVVPSVRRILKDFDEQFPRSAANPEGVVRLLNRLSAEWMEINKDTWADPRFYDLVGYELLKIKEEDENTTRFSGIKKRVRDFFNYMGWPVHVALISPDDVVASAFGGKVDQALLTKPVLRLLSFVNKNIALNSLENRRVIYWFCRFETFYVYEKKEEAKKKVTENIHALLAALGEDFDIDSPPPKCEQTRSSGEEAPKVSVNRLADMCLDNRRRMAKLERLVEKIAEIFKKEETNERNF